MKKELLLLSGLLVSVAAFACEYLTVRDSAFVEPRDVHRLVLFTAEGDEGADEIARRLGDRLGLHGEDLNLEFEQVAVDAEGIDWSAYGIPGPPPSTPVTVLVGSNQRSGKPFFIKHWVPAPTDEEMNALIASPFRDRLAETLIREVAVIVHVPATTNAREDVSTLLAGVEAEWDAKEKCGVSRMTLDRTVPGEELLLSFLGVPEEGPDWVGVFFGRTKAMDPWIGEEIQAADLHHQIETLVGECNCLQTAGSLGVDLPMIWTKAMDDSRTFLREATEEEETTALAGLRNSRLLGGPMGIAIGGFLAAVLLGGGFLLLRSRRSAVPLVTSANR